MAINNNFETVAVSLNSDDTVLNLFNFFDDTLTTGKIATFDFYEDSFAQDISILLFDQNGDGAPITVDNFLTYINDGDYVNSIIHRSIPGFIIQGGGFVLEDLAVSNVPTDDPILNEFSPERSNTRGTISMAKVGPAPGQEPTAETINSATSQWFFNLDDNSQNLDNQNGGFTVFGEVLSESDLNAIDTIATVPIFDGTNINPAFSDLPADVDPANPQIVDDNEYIRLRNIIIGEQAELSFLIEDNSNPNLVTATINQNNGRIRLDYAPEADGVAEITVKATNLLGESRTDVLRVSVVGNLDTPIIRYENNDVPGTFLFATEAEAESIGDFPQFEEQGFAFQVSSVPDDDLIVFNRFRNRNLDGTYLYATAQESRSIRRQFPEFIEEGVAFYAYGADAERGVDFFRFQNTQQPGTYIFVNETERQNILTNFPQFVEEGVAFEVLG